MKKRQRLRKGDFVKINLGNGMLAFGRVLTDPLVAFYDFTSPKLPRLEELAKMPIAFRIWVSNYAICDGDWPIIGHAPLTPDLEQPVRFLNKILLRENYHIR